MYSGRANILIVDDEPTVSDLLYEDLSELGFNCTTATTGEDALKRLSKDNCDVMLLDIKLPGISGMDVLRKTISDYPEIAAIVVTGLGDAQTAVEAMKIGAVDYITKPFEIEKVNSSIEATLQTKVIPKRAPVPEREGAKCHGEDTGWMRYLDDMAEGVATRLDSLTGHVMTLTIIEQTIDTARRLEIPEEHIEKWADGRRKDIERVKILDHLVEKRL